MTSDAKRTRMEGPSTKGERAAIWHLGQIKNEAGASCWHPRKGKAIPGRGFFGFCQTAPAVQIPGALVQVSFVLSPLLVMLLLLIRGVRGSSGGFHTPFP